MSDDATDQNYYQNPVQLTKSNTALVVQVGASDVRRTISLSIVADFVGYARIRTGKSWGISTPQFVGYARTKASRSGTTVPGLKN
ncbi:hypothetical protein MJO28_012134 [Puccinia striiformis f. sp. tritici]|uniref:Uncharacterized protein n=1 Tax=Puccinia striiformis f. sp. tritici TaxID=168172 RepID=A0ACC0DZB7_9BASI|nr:hypothetical protein MJO28_012134 [Puccinia striiformis f. sp. tritici]